MTQIVTVEPSRALVPPAGDCFQTRPLFFLERPRPDSDWTITLGRKPAFRIAASAAPRV